MLKIKLTILAWASRVQRRRERAQRKLEHEARNVCWSQNIIYQGVQHLVLNKGLKGCTLVYEQEGLIHPICAFILS